ncbi:hypothetical protein GCM10027074_22050 [Streptomyces deserti]
MVIDRSERCGRAGGAMSQVRGLCSAGRTEDGLLGAVVGRPKVVEGGPTDRRLAAGGWRLAAGGWRLAAGGGLVSRTAHDEAGTVRRTP